MTREELQRIIDVIVQELAATGARIFRTDQDGTVIVSFSGQGIQVRSDT